MNNVLLVDTNFSSGPIYQYLIQAGYYVTVVGNNPSDALAKSVDDYVNLDYSDIARIKKLIKERKIDYLVPGCNDRSYMICAQLNSNGRFPGIDDYATAQIINNKQKFRAFAAIHSLPIPEVLQQHEIGKRWPVIVKPADAFSGRGITIIPNRNETELLSAIKLAQKESKLGVSMIEEYVVGQLYSHTAFVQGGNIFIDFIVEEHSTANPFVVDTSRVIYNFSEVLLAGIRGNILKIAKELRLQDGLIHTQFISNGSQYWLIEVTRRCPGDLYSQLIELSTGFEYAKNYTNPFISRPFQMELPITQRWIMRHTLSQSVSFTLGSLSFKNPLKLIKWVPISNSGDKLQASPYGRIAIIFVEESNEQKLNKIFKVTLHRQLYEVNP